MTETNKDPVTLTPKAAEYFQKHLKKHPGTIGVRLSVKPSGCSGLKYVLDYVKTPQETDFIIRHEDLIFYVDAKSIPFIEGVIVDYEKQGLNERIVFRNPKEAGSCGCGESFTVKDS